MKNVKKLDFLAFFIGFLTSKSYFLIFFLGILTFKSQNPIRRLNLAGRGCLALAGQPLAGRHCLALAGPRSPALAGWPLASCCGLALPAWRWLAGPDCLALDGWPGLPGRRLASRF